MATGQLERLLKVSGLAAPRLVSGYRLFHEGEGRMQA